MVPIAAPLKPPPAPPFPLVGGELQSEDTQDEVGDGEEWLGLWFLWKPISGDLFCGMWLLLLLPLLLLLGRFEDCCCSIIGRVLGDRGDRSMPFF